MPKVAFGLGAYRRDNGNLPELRCVNMMAEAAPTADQGVVLMSRKGLVEDEEVGSGPIKGVFRDDGTFSGDRFVISGDNFYRAGVLVGTVEINGPVSWASSGLELVFAGGTKAYSYDGTDLEERSGSGKFYWSDVLDGRTVGALSFATAESAADNLLDLYIIKGNLFLAGGKTIEVWRTTGNAELPYSLIQQSTASKGILATGCGADADNGFVWLGQDCILYRWGEQPQRLSDSGLEERIKASASRTLFRMDYEGHVLILIRLDDATFAWDAQTQQLHELKSYGFDNFRGQCCLNDGPDAYLGDDTTGQIWTFDGYADDGAELVREFTAFFKIDSDPVPVNNLWLEANFGRTDLLAGQGSDPVVEMQSTDDAAATWSSWEEAELGQQGQYRVIAEWRALGLFDVPGAGFGFRCSDPVPLRISAVHLNDPIPGRSR
jgi:hypothetical protein